MRARTMVHAGNNSVIRILSSVDLSRPVANPRARAVRKVQPHLLTLVGAAAAVHPRSVNDRINMDMRLAQRCKIINSDFDRQK